MEKSRAIELLEHLAWDRDIDRNPYGDALNMAIDALKAQHSCEGTTKGTTSDLISKTETVERLRKAVEITYPSTDHDGGYVDGIETGISIVSTMPTIQPVATDTNVGDTFSQQAVKYLDKFTKTFCRDNSVKDDLVFRCSHCDFQVQNGYCLVKIMARKLCPDYKDFGSMGDL